MARSTFPPAPTSRLLASYGADEVELDSHRAFLIGRLFEEGDSRDLQWLTDNVPEQELSCWLRSHGGRRLSRRSLAFWATLLHDLVALDSRPSEIEDLWPL
jgi:hypothetical protein